MGVCVCVFDVRVFEWPIYGSRNIDIFSFAQLTSVHIHAKTRKRGVAATFSIWNTLSSVSLPTLTIEINTHMHTHISLSPKWSVKASVTFNRNDNLLVFSQPKFVSLRTPRFNTINFILFHRNCKILVAILQLNAALVQLEKIVSIQADIPHQNLYPFISRPEPTLMFPHRSIASVRNPQIIRTQGYKFIASQEIRIAINSWMRPSIFPRFLVGFEFRAPCDWWFSNEICFCKWNNKIASNEPDSKYPSILVLS